VFVAWTLFVWATRIRNIWTDDTLTTSGQLGRTALVLAFVVPAVAVAVGLVRRRGAPWLTWVIRGFAAWTVGFWVVRLVGIVLHGQSAAFVAVHAVLGLVSSVLAIAAWRTTMPAVMGQPVTVIEKPAPRHGMVRFEINRSLTGMAHEHYAAGQAIPGSRPPDELAKRLFEHGGVATVHINSNVITVELEDGHGSAGLQEIIEGLFTFYREGVTPAPVADA
jgi:hypothetical protein